MNTISKKDAQKWANALRSGEFKQTIGHLENGDGHCCLGVACEIFIPKRKQVRNANGTLKGFGPRDQFEAPTWLKKINGHFEEVSGRGVDVLNDGDGYDFDMIADLIELVYVHKAL